MDYSPNLCWLGGAPLPPGAHGEGVADARLWRCRRLPGPHPHSGKRTAGPGTEAEGWQDDARAGRMDRCLREGDGGGCPLPQARAVAPHRGGAGAWRGDTMTLSDKQIAASRRRLWAGATGEITFHLHLTNQRNGARPSWSGVFQPDPRLCGTDRCVPVTTVPPLRLRKRHLVGARA